MDKRGRIVWMPADDTEKEVRASKNPNGPFNHQRFFSLAELNAAIRDLVVQITVMDA